MKWPGAGFRFDRAGASGDNTTHLPGAAGGGGCPAANDSAWSRSGDAVMGSQFRRGSTARGLWAVALLLAFGSFGQAESTPSAKSPNIILIIADDKG